RVLFRSGNLFGFVFAFLLLLVRVRVDVFHCCFPSEIRPASRLGSGCTAGLRTEYFFDEIRSFTLTGNSSNAREMRGLESEEIEHGGDPVIHTYRRNAEFPAERLNALLHGLSAQMDFPGDFFVSEATNEAEGDCAFSFTQIQS